MSIFRYILDISFHLCIFLKKFLKDYLYICGESAVACESVKRVPGLLELELQAIMNGLTWCLGIEFGSSANKTTYRLLIELIQDRACQLQHCIVGLVLQSGAVLFIIGAVHPQLCTQRVPAASPLVIIRSDLIPSISQV